MKSRPLKHRLVLIPIHAPQNPVTFPIKRHMQKQLFKPSIRQIVMLSHQIHPINQMQPTIMIPLLTQQHRTRRQFKPFIRNQPINPRISRLEISFTHTPKNLQ